MKVLITILKLVFTELNFMLEYQEDININELRKQRANWDKIDRSEILSRFKFS